MTTFYVDTNATGASDNNAGTSLAAPLKTIGQALVLSQNNNATSQSDTIYIRGGVYREQPFVWTKNSGASATDRTIISAYVNPVTGGYEPVYIDAADPTTGTWIQDGTSNRWYLPNFNTKTSGVWVDWSPGNDGASLQQIGGYNQGHADQRPLVGSGVGDMFAGSYYGDLTTSRLYVWLADGSNPNSHTIEYANRGREFYEPGTAIAGGFSYANYIDFKGLNLRHDNVYDTVGQDTGCAMYTEGDQRLIDMDIEWNAGEGVFLRGTSQMINCTVNNNGGNAVAPQGHGFVISGGHYNYNYWRNYQDGSAAAIKVITNDPLSYGDINNIESAYNYGKGIWYDTDFENSVVSHLTGNYIHDNEGSGINIEASRNYVIANNVIAGNQSDGIALNAAENVEIYNNTLIGNYGVAAIELDGGTRSQGTIFPGTIGMLNNSIRNNIIANNFTVYDLDVPTLAAPSTEINNNTSDYNLFYRRGGPLHFTNGGTYVGWGSTPATLAGWQSASRQDAHSMVADPLFMSGGTGANAYAIGSNSPAIAAGMNLFPAVTTDYTGAARSQTAEYDLGAFGYAGGGPGSPGPVVVNTDPSVWVDDQLPDNSAMTAPDASGNMLQNQFWFWNSTNNFSGAAALDSTVMDGAHRQYFTGANPRAIAANDTLFAYVWIDPANPTDEIMLEWKDSSGSWNHLAYWGSNSLGSGVDGSTGLHSIGPLPTPGQWALLSVPASVVGLAGKNITGFSFDLYNGRALIDKIGNGSVNVVANGGIGGTVYQDNNGNAAMDAGENGLANVTVFLDLNGNGVQDAGEPFTTTDSTGAYSFSNLSSGSYTVCQVVPAGYAPSTITGTSAIVNVNSASTTTQNLGEFPTTLNASSTQYNFTVRLSPDGTQEQIWQGVPESAAPTYAIGYGVLPQLTIQTDFVFSTSVTVDFTNGAPMPSGAFTFAGGGFTGDFNVLGLTAQPNTFTVNGGTVTVNGVDMNVLYASSINLTGGSANDLVIQNASPCPVSFSGGLGNDVLDVNAGQYTFNGDPSPATAALTVNLASGTSALFAAGLSGAGVNTYHLAGLNISGGAVAELVPASDAADRSVLVLQSLSLGSTSLAPAGLLDLGNNDMILQGGDMSAIQADIASAYASGAWTGPAGITSQSAQFDATHLTALGVSTGTSLPFDGQNISAADVLVKYTYYGDTNLDGKIDGSDYSRMDFGTLFGATGWNNGDFNYDGIINGSDYSLLDNAFNMQGATIAAAIAPPAVTLAAPVPPAANVFVTAVTAPDASVGAILGRTDYLTWSPQIADVVDKLKAAAPVARLTAA